MTVIAYKAGIMACDSLWNDDGLTVSSANKIIRLPTGALLGEAGDTDTRAIVALFEKVKGVKSLPTRAALMATGLDYHALLVLANGMVFDVAIDQDKKDGGLFRAMRPFYAVGAGKQVAIGAMAAGASAAQAVAIACQHVMSCRGPVHVEPLKPKRQCAKP